MLRLQPGKHPETGRDILLATVQISEALDPLGLLRTLKQLYPKLWQQVNLEMLKPTALDRAIVNDSVPQKPNPPDIQRLREGDTKPRITDL